MTSMWWYMKCFFALYLTCSLATCISFNSKERYRNLVFDTQPQDYYGDGDEGYVTSTPLRSIHSPILRPHGRSRTSQSCGVRKSESSAPATVTTTTPAKEQEQTSDNKEDDDDGQVEDHYEASEVLDVTEDGDDIFVPDAEEDETAPEGRIIEGEIAPIEQWPWQVTVTFNKQHECGGVLIDDRHVLSAGHCFRGLQNVQTEYVVYFGKSLKSVGEPGEISRRVEKIILHPEFDKPMKANNDFSIIRLSKPVTFSDKVAPVCLPSRNELLPNGTTCYVTGYGSTEGTRGENNLKVGTLVHIDRHICVQHFEHEITDRMICAIDYLHGDDACGGDSGGPLVASKDGGKTFKVFGIVSFGANCKVRKITPGVYARVAGAIDWIQSVTAKK